ncbi:adenosine deaminase [Chloroflexota bacterium]
MDSFPKAELHLHIEGTLEPELMFALAQRNEIQLPHASVDEIRALYSFSNLQSFLDIYYQGCNVLVKEEDFYDLTHAYLEKISKQGVLHTEIFFDPQTHTERKIPFETVVNGIQRALTDGREKFGISSKMIMCFLRHLPAESAMETLEESLPYKSMITAVGLDSSEVGHPPEKFNAVFERALEEGFLTVAHAGEEGPPEYIWQALDVLKASRIDHGVRALEDLKLVERLVKDQVPLTVCPLSNIKLKVFDELTDHNLKKLMDLGVCVTINSDDPAYFGGYIGENYEQARKALDLTPKEIHQLAKNSFNASFLTETEKKALIARLDAETALLIE